MPQAGSDIEARVHRQVAPPPFTVLRPCAQCLDVRSALWHGSAVSLLRIIIKLRINPMLAPSSHDPAPPNEQDDQREAPTGHACPEGCPRGLPGRSRDANDLRCSCGSLLGRFVETGLEMKCRRCKRCVVTHPRPSRSRAPQGGGVVPRLVGDQIRCTCGSLLAKTAAQRLWLRCRHCKREERIGACPAQPLSLDAVARP